MGVDRLPSRKAWNACSGGITCKPSTAKLFHERQPETSSLTAPGIDPFALKISCTAALYWTADDMFPPPKLYAGALPLPIEYPVAPVHVFGLR